MALTGAYSKVEGGVVTSYSLLGTFTTALLGVDSLTNLQFQLSGDTTYPTESETTNLTPLGNLTEINLVTCTAHTEGGKLYALRQGSKVIIGVTGTVNSICIFDLTGNLIGRMLILDENGIPTSIIMAATETFMVSINIALDITSMPILGIGDSYDYSISYPVTTQGSKLAGFFAGEFTELFDGSLSFTLAGDTTLYPISTEEYSEVYDIATRKLTLIITLLPQAGNDRTISSIRGTGNGTVAINFTTLFVPKLVGVTLEFGLTWGS